MLEGGRGEGVGMRKREERIVIYMNNLFILIYNMHFMNQ